MKNTIIVLALLIYTIVSQTSITQAIDGDTIIVNDDRVIRLARIDTPEYNESGYQEAKDFMLQYIGKEIELDCEDELGYYGREICEVYYKDTSLNQLLLDEGLAKKY